MTTLEILEKIKNHVKRTGRNPWKKLALMQRRGVISYEEELGANLALDRAYDTLFPHSAMLSSDERMQVVTRAIETAAREAIAARDGAAACR